MAYIYGSGFTGGLSAHFNSRISFFEEFLGTFYGDSSISATVLPPMQCSRYSNITAFPGGIVQGMFGPLTNADVFAFDDCHVTIQ